MSIPRVCPIGRKRKRSPRVDLEGSLVRECLAYLRDNLDVVYVERRNTGALRVQGGGFIRFGAKGAADIWCLVASERNWPHLRHVEIECKRADGKGRLSPDQKRFQAFCRNEAIPYFVVTSAEELALRIDAL